MNYFKFFALTLLVTITTSYGMQTNSKKADELNKGGTQTEQIVQPARSNKPDRCPFKCFFKKCKRGFTTEDALIYHINVTHGESDEPVRPKTDLNNANGSSSNQPSQALQATQDFDAMLKAEAQPEQTALMQAPLVQSSPEDISDSSVFACTSCKRIFGSNAELMLHTAMNHPKNFNMEQSKRSVLQKCLLLKPQASDSNGSSSNQPPAQSMFASTSFSSLAKPNSNSNNDKKRDPELKLEADENAAKKQRLQPSNEALFAAIDANSASHVAELIAQKADVNAPRTAVNNNYLHLETALARAATLGNKEIIKLLLEAKACPNTVAANPLAQATQSGSLDLFFALLQAGADTNMRGSNGTTIVDILKDHPMKDVMLAIIEANQKHKSAPNSNSNAMQE